VRTAVFGLAALLETLLLYLLDDAEHASWFTPARPYTIFPAFAGMVAFMVGGGGAAAVAWLFNWLAGWLSWLGSAPN
jgi:hypothetical protein